MTKSQIIRYLILRSIGNFLLLFSIFGIAATFGPSIWYEAQFRIAKIRGVSFTIAEEKKNKEKTGFGQILEQQRIAQSGGFRAILTGSKEQILIPKDTEFSVLIPKLGANQKVFANVDANNENEFLPILYQGVAHAKGTVFPGMKGNIYLFAHSSDNFWDVGRYNAVFYLLKDLAAGDDIVIFFENKRHDYKVSETKVLDASDVSLLVESQNQKEEKLILQTCWPPGTTWKRLLVFARPK